MEWLARHQDPDGSWDCDGFDARCNVLGDPSSGSGGDGQQVCSGVGYPEHDVGVTALALLAFLRAGFVADSPEYGEVLRRGLSWLAMKSQENGLIGDRSTREFIYSHAIATLVLAESTSSGFRIDTFRDVIERAVKVIYAAQVPGSGWRYDWPHEDEADVSVTGWMLAALDAVRKTGISVPSRAFDSGLSFISSMTDESSGRIGYISPGGGSARIPGINEHYLIHDTETMTATGLLSIALTHQDPLKLKAIEKYAELIMKAMPVWKTRTAGNDMYYWRAASEAFYHSRNLSKKFSRYWKSWSQAMLKAARAAQHEKGDLAGSWDPSGPWGFAGGRVYSTSLMTLSLISTVED